MTSPNIPQVTQADIVAGIRRLGLGAGEKVMVHSSLKSFGHVVGGAETVIRALMELLTPAGDLMMPSFNHGREFREGGPGCIDPLTSRTTNGTIPDTFWRMEGVCRSWNPTHMIAAWGANAGRYTQFHHRTLTVGPDSPLGLLGREGGWGLLLGVTFRANTYHHVVEMTCGAPCLGRRTEKYLLRLPDGRMVECRGWSWRDQGCPFTDGARYADVMSARGMVRETAIGGSLVKCFRLSDCFEVVADLLTRGGLGFPPCSACPSRPRVGPRTVPSDWDDDNNCLRPDSLALEY